MWPPEKWERELAKLAAERQRRRAQANRLADAMEFRGKVPPPPVHAAGCGPGWGPCTCGAAVDLRKPFDHDVPLRLQAAAIVLQRQNARASSEKREANIRSGRTTRVNPGRFKTGSVEGERE
jgi:hypothetical protein